MTERRKYHHGDLRRALIDAAVELLAEDGMKHLSLRQVARRVGVSHAAPYRHFADKEALLAVVAEEGFKAFTRCLQTAVDAAPDDPTRQFLGCGRAYVRFALDNSTHYRLMFSEFPFCEDRFEALNRVADASFDVLVNVITGGQRQGLFRSGDARLMALTAWAQVHGLALLLLAGRLGIQGEATVDKVAEALGQTLLQGVAAANEADGGEPAGNT